MTRSILLCGMPECKRPAWFRITTLADDVTHLICAPCLKDGVLAAIHEAAMAASVKHGEFVPAPQILDSQGAPIAQGSDSH